MSPGNGKNKTCRPEDVWQWRLLPSVYSEFLGMSCYYRNHAISWRALITTHAAVGGNESVLSVQSEPRKVAVWWFWLLALITWCAAHRVALFCPQVRLVRSSARSGIRTNGTGRRSILVWHLKSNKSPSDSKYETYAVSVVWDKFGAGCLFRRSCSSAVWAV